MIKTLAKMLGLSTEHAEASLHSERAARAVLTRRNLFAAGGALAAGSVFSFAAPDPFRHTWDWATIQIKVGEKLIHYPGVVFIHDEVIVERSALYASYQNGEMRWAK